MTQLDPTRYKLTEQESRAIFQKHIAPTLLAGAEPSTSPKAIILGGQPGAGKTLVMNESTRELAQTGKPVAIVGDDLRAFHPRYAELSRKDPLNAAHYTDQDSGRWVEMLIAAAKEKRVNVVIEGTMRRPEKVAQTMQELKAGGYQVEARALAVNERVSWQGVHTRYERQIGQGDVARFTQRSSHDAGAAGMLQTLAEIERGKLADQVKIQGRDGRTLYENELQGGDWQRRPGAADAVLGERQRTRTPDEAREHDDAWSKILSDMKRRGASADELQTVQRQQRADAFALMPRELAVKRHPDLVNAYAAVRLMELSAIKKGATPEAAGFYGAAMKEALTQRIERGEKLPEVQLRAQSRDVGPER